MVGAEEVGGVGDHPRRSYAFVDRALYLPKAWTDDPARLAAAHVPAGIGFATKPQLARRMVERAMASGVPFVWVTADTVYGVSELEMALRMRARATCSACPGPWGSVRARATDLWPEKVWWFCCKDWLTKWVNNNLP